MCMLQAFTGIREHFVRANASRLGLFDEERVCLACASGTHHLQLVQECLVLLS